MLLATPAAWPPASARHPLPLTLCLLLLLLQIIDAERATAAAKQLAKEAKEQQRQVEVALKKQQEAAQKLQDQLAHATRERQQAQNQLAVAEGKVRAGERGTATLHWHAC